MKKLIQESTHKSHLKKEINSILELLPKIDFIQHENGEIDYYGASWLIANSTGREKPLASKARWVHGWNRFPTKFLPTIYHSEQHKSEPILVAKTEEARYLNKNGIISHAISVPFVYTKKSNVKRIQNSLLIMPFHSTTHSIYSNLKYNIIHNTQLERKKFDLVVSCISGMDVSHFNMINEFEQINIPWITGAWIFDKNALQRMRIIFEIFENIITDFISSHILYAAFCGCKIIISNELSCRDINSYIHEPLFIKHPELIKENVIINSPQHIKKQYPFLFECEKSIDISSWASKELGFHNKKDPNLVSHFLGWDDKQHQYARKKIGIINNPTRNTKYLNINNFLDYNSQELSTIQYQTATDQSSEFIFRGSLTDALNTLKTKATNFPRRQIGHVVIEETRFAFADLHSFYHELDQIFGKNLYGFHTQEDRPLIIDCGAHVGLATLYFARRYPQSIIHAFEADPNIHNLLRSNVESSALDNVTLHARAVWIHDDGVRFHLSGDDSGHINPEDGTKIPSIRLKNVLEQFDRIDMLKLDVEGAEYEILDDCLPVLNRVQNMIIEVHRLDDDKKSLVSIFNMLESIGFQYTISDFHTATWAQPKDIPPFDFITHDKCIMKVFAWRHMRLGLQSNITNQQSRTQKHATRPVITHLCTLDHGGAGAAALRLHLGLLGQGIDSKMLVLCAKSGMSEVYETPTQHEHQSQESWKYIYNHWTRVLREHPNRPDGLEFFTDISSDAILANHPLLKQADIVHLHWIPGLIDVQSMPALFGGKKIIWTLHDQNPFTGGCHFAGDCRKFESHCHSCPQLGSEVDADLSFQQWNAKNIAYQNIDLKIITPSRWLAQEAKRSSLFSQRCISVIPYGLQLGIFQPLPSSNLREKHGLSTNDFVILFGAHAHTRRKGFEHLKALLEVIPPYLQGKRVVAVAFGHISKNMTNRVPVLEVGFVADPHKLAQFYSMADVYVLPAIEDNLPNTVLEALACGTPIVGFDIGGMPDMVNHGINGWLTTLGDIDGLVQGIMWAKKFGANSREAIAADARQRFHDGLQAARYLELYQKNSNTLNDSVYDAPALSIPLCTPKHFSHFAYAKKSHFEAFRGLDTSLYGKPVNLAQCDLKRYQDLLVLSFITATIPQGAKILEVGGGNSRILAHLAGRYECWNVDKFEGLGNGPKALPKSGYRVIQDYLGSNNPELPDNYFDLVFSISALEHTPNDEKLFQNILHDIHRVLKNGGRSLHLFDVVFKPEGFWTNQFLPYLFQNASPLFPMPDPKVMQKDPDLYVMSKAAYDNGWKKITSKTYEDFGRPTSINILWHKSLDSALTDISKNSFKPKKNDVWAGPEILVPSSLPTISIVTPSFNQGEFLDECIDSILGQRYPNLEYVIMDGGSTDGSVDIIKKNTKYLKYWQSKKDSGQYWAINEGFKHTAGEVMAWLNSDDKYHPQSLFKIANFFDSSPESEWVMGRPTIWNTQGELIHIVEKIPSWSQKIYLDGNYGPPHIQQESTFWKRSIWDKSGGYIDINLKYAGDMELWSRFFRHTKLHILDDLIGGFRTQPKSKTYTSLDLYNKEADIIIARERKIYNYE